jgi:hypothetical protein
MSFIKKNYEKILLGAVLLGALGFLLFLPIIIGREQQELLAKETTIIQTPPKPLPELDMSRETNILGRVQEPYTLDFEATNRLFNSVQWQKKPDGTWIKIVNGSIVGPGAVKVTNIMPLHFILRLDSIEPANQFSPARYVVSIQRENAETPVLRRPRQHFISVGEKDDSLSLISVSGSPDDPQLLIQILDSGEKVLLAKNKPYQRVDGYSADLTYPPEGKKWTDQRVGATLKFYGGDYNIVVIDQSEVVLSAQLNQKKTTIPYQP